LPGDQSWQPASSCAITFDSLVLLHRAMVDMAHRSDLVAVVRERGVVLVALWS
jgi:hypothetical protein